MTAKLLVVTEREAVVNRIRAVGKSVTSGLAIVAANGLPDARSILAREAIHVILVHLDSDSGSEREIAEFIGWVASGRPSCPTFVLAEAYQEFQAVALLRAGAADYLNMDQDRVRLTFLLHTIAMRFGATSQPLGSRPQEEAPQRDPFYYVVAAESADPMEQVRRVAGQATSILLTGEPGTGKSRLARIIHELSPRLQQPFVAVECDAPSANLVESNLFGYVKDAFTGADRDRQGTLAEVGNGTLLLDDVDALPLPLQNSLLDVLTERAFKPIGSEQTLPFTGRVIASSAVPLDQQVLAGAFRGDLYYRLNGVGFFLPPLREQRAAIAPLCRRFLSELARVGSPRFLVPAVLDAFTSYDWPGNIRELRNVLEQALASAPRAEISLSDIPERVAAAYQPGKAHVSVAAVSGTQECNVEAADHRPADRHDEAEIRQIRAALKKHRNNRLRAAVELGISRMGLYKKLHKYGLLEAL